MLSDILGWLYTFSLLLVMMMHLKYWVCHAWPVMLLAEDELTDEELVLLGIGEYPWLWPIRRNAPGPAYAYPESKACSDPSS
ncbi:MAG: hypothetical protein HYX27_00335 [Acidobacteria bacterium]|nr:hypothetical protein [Acidobacteriota bacterium]